MTGRGGPTVEYELTIDSGLGPVLRNALGPELVARTRTCTTLVAVTAADVDALVAVIHALGLRLESVVVVDPAVATLSP
ncbi:hypothetical protein IDH50_13945 [Aeromicrobium tamlense]|uniref:Uncharacterized protein n=1 Tax=Aeromicrobium tamlense TaxID=375541 RepID=A0A8I0FX23_9ACTN|nr:hypothetical protein [Aeromicrobium tamlense]MBD1270526.1 hypothetical protein [Aeromicrobium tamlense]MBD1271342.1 hypothetical protein [Aeromicrobium tamlense]NYI37913.1 hypothetical protein [Aeromicrobium tamlense]